MVRGVSYGFGSVIAKHTYKHVAEVQSHRGLIRDKRNKIFVYKCNMSAASHGGLSQSKYSLGKSNIISN